MNGQYRGTNRDKASNEQIFALCQLLWTDETLHSAFNRVGVDGYFDMDEYIRIHNMVTEYWQATGGDLRSTISSSTSSTLAGIFIWAIYSLLKRSCEKSQRIFFQRWIVNNHKILSPDTDRTATKVAVLCTRYQPVSMKCLS